MKQGDMIYLFYVIEQLKRLNLEITEPSPGEFHLNALQKAGGRIFLFKAVSLEAVLEGAFNNLLKTIVEHKRCIAKAKEDGRAVDKLGYKSAKELDDANQRD